MADQVQTADPRHLVVRNDEVDGRVFQNLHGIHDIGSRKDAMAFRYEIALKNVYGGWGVVNDEDAFVS